MDKLSWIEKWYELHCDGDWEHEYGIRIYNVDNPGWSIVVDLTGTSLEGSSNIEWQLYENDEHDWYGFQIKDNQFKASGDPTKLQFLLDKFRELVELGSL